MAGGIGGGEEGGGDPLAYTNSTSTTTIIGCGFGGLQVNAWMLGTTKVVKAMVGTVKVWP